MRQQLSPAARRAKAARDKAYAMTPARKAKKAHSQRERSAAKKKGINLDGRITITKDRSLCLLILIEAMRVRVLSQKAVITITQTN